MAKISPTSIKYSIIADFTAEGPFQKPDVIGALFGQTEGLLGPDMELRELQKEGKIGRVEVELKSENGKTTGTITIPSALDKTETSLIAAALETIDKIGPTDAKITIRKIDDVRKSKREYIMERAKALLANIQSNTMDTTEVENILRESTRVAKVTEYGEEALAAGPDIDSSEEVIVVEGRADVINLLKHGIRNVIGMHGTRLPKTITKLGEEKTLTLFVDGDRGGELIAKNVSENANIKYIAQAPSGKEVEELTGKEIHQALRKKLSVEDFFYKHSRHSHRDKRERHDSFSRKSTAQKDDLTVDEIKKLGELAEEVKGRNVLLLDEDLNVLKNIPSSRISKTRLDNVAIVLANHATSTIVTEAQKAGIPIVAAKTFGRVPEDSAVKLFSI